MPRFVRLPSGLLVAADIADGTAAGRALFTAANTAAQLALLGILNVGDLRNYAVSRAISLLGMSRPRVALDQSFAAKPGTRNNFFDGASTNVTNKTGGWKKITTSGTPGNEVAWTHADPTTSTFVNNISTDPWYMLWLASFDTAVDSTVILQLGWINSGLSNANAPCVGVKGASSTTKFRAFDNAGGVNSSVNIDTGPHLFEMLGNGAGTISFGVDGESLGTFATGITSNGTPNVRLTEGSSGAQSVSIGHCLILTAT